ncbi:MAG: crotonase/enoyl-CoA hydratase family protein [Rhodobacteraceae bacterium]|nr:crotonase/enoyl-CoA hydratase family protein [Paracoccaceae bacterium]
MPELVLMETKGNVAVLTLNRPEKLNALNYALNDRLLALLDRIETDPALRAVVLTGAGRAFSAGGDIPEFAASIRAGGDLASREFVARGQRLTARLEAFPKPVIVAVNGLAYGGGCEITEAAHLAVAVTTARFAKPEVRIGIPPTFGGTQRLPRLAGRKRALEHLLTGDSFGAEQALAMGLINRVVSPGDLMPAALTLAAAITRNAPPVVARIIAAVTRGLNLPIAEGLALEGDQFARVAGSADTAEGLAAWLERREPDWG